MCDPNYCLGDGSYGFHWLSDDGGGGCSGIRDGLLLFEVLAWVWNTQHTPVPTLPQKERPSPTPDTVERGQTLEDAILQQVLTYNMARQWKRPIIISSVGDTQWYNRVAHIITAIAIRAANILERIGFHPRSHTNVGSSTTDILVGDLYGSTLAKNADFQSTLALWLLPHYFPVQV